MASFSAGLRYYKRVNGDSFYHLQITLFLRSLVHVVSGGRKSIIVVLQINSVYYVLNITEIAQRL